MADNNGLTRVEPPPQPQAKDAKWCHRFFIPMTFAEQRPNPLNPREMMVEPKAQGVFVKCLGQECAIWDNDRKQCSDKTKALSLAALADRRLAKRGLHRDGPSGAEARDLLGADLAGTLDGPPRRMSVAEITRHVTRIEEL